jgi:predicted transcriptional regulator
VIKIIYRAETDKGNFVQINKDLVNDATLSMYAKSVMMYLLSQNNDWKFYMSDIKKHFTDNIVHVRKGLQELEKAGYVERHQTKVKGKFVYIYDIFETREVRKMYNQLCEENQNVKTKPKTNHTESEDESDYF